MLRVFAVFALCVMTLSGCVTTTAEPVKSTNKSSEDLDKSSALKAWWLFLNDPVLNSFISSALNLNYNNVSPKNDLVFDIVNKYVEYRYIQNQKTELSKHDINNSKQGILLENQAFEILSELTRLTKLLPEYVVELLKEESNIPKSDITPILASEASIIASSPDMRGAFPDMTIGSFFGISNDVYLNNGQKWSVTAGNAIKNLDKNHSNIDDISAFITNIEYKIISYANMEEQYIVLKNATDKYETKCLTMISNCDEAYKTKLASLRAEYEKSKILINLYQLLEYQK